MGLSEPATSSEQGCQSSTLYEIQLAPFGLISTKCTENSNQASIRILVRGPGVRETSVFSDPTTNELPSLSLSFHATVLAQKEKLLQCLASPSSANPKEELFMHNSLELKIRKTGKTRKIYSSTSSVYAEHTLSDPNNDQVLYW